MFPRASVATASGAPTDPAMAGTGAGGGAPPAYVEITYCWAAAAALNSRMPKVTRAELIMPSRGCRPSPCEDHQVFLCWSVLRSDSNLQRHLPAVGGNCAQHPPRDPPRFLVEHLSRPVIQFS